MYGKTVLALALYAVAFGCARSNDDSSGETADPARRCRKHCDAGPRDSGHDASTDAAALDAFAPDAASADAAALDATGPDAAAPDAAAPDAAAPDAAADAGVSGAHIQTVFIILMENHDWSSIKGSASAPYINDTLLPMAAHAEQYMNPPGNHPSLPNYLWLEAGTNFGISNDSAPSVNHQSTTNHLVTFLMNAGISWKTYQEDITGSTCPLTSSGNYAVKHNPFVYFDDSTGARNTHDSGCISHNRPFTELATDLSNGTVARYNFITPNLCDDGHDSCAPLNDPVAQSDSWLKAQVPVILASSAYQNGGALFITWDEGEGDDGPIGMIVLSPFAKGGGYANTIGYTHSSTLRTMQEIFGVMPLLGDAANATDLSDLFRVFP